MVREFYEKEGGMSGYEYSKLWFDFSINNPEKINTNHAALFFFAVDLCNRLAWPEKFGIPTYTAMAAIGIKNFRTYSKAFENLVEWGFFIVHQKSKNQYSATVIALVKNTKALHKQIPKHCLSTATINKPLKTIKNKESGKKHFSPPSLVDVEAYFEIKIKEKNLSISAKVEAEKFESFYSSKNWMIGKNKMTDWKKAVSGWISRLSNDKTPQTKAISTKIEVTTDWGHNV
jgi:hypothetical protein